MCVPTFFIGFPEMVQYFLYTSSNYVHKKLRFTTQNSFTWNLTTPLYPMSLS